MPRRTSLTTRTSVRFTLIVAGIEVLYLLVTVTQL
jgi:hypothetical protein